jgi:hypothetical protein
MKKYDYLKIFLFAIIFAAIIIVPQIFHGSAKNISRFILAVGGLVAGFLVVKRQRKNKETYRSYLRLPPNTTNTKNV